MCAQRLQLCLPLAILWTATHQAPLSMGFFRHEYRSGLPCPPPGDLPNQDQTHIYHIAGRFSTTDPAGKPSF